MTSEERFGELGFEEEESMVTITDNLRVYYNIYCNIIFDNVIYNMSLSCLPENELFRQWGKPPRPSVFAALLRVERCKEQVK